MSAGRIYTMLLEATLLALAVGIFMTYVALDHNPQQEFFDTESGRVVTENLLPVMLSWFLATAIVYGILRATVTWLVLRAVRRNS